MHGSDAPPLLQRLEPRLRDRGVLRRAHTADAHTADDLAADQDGSAAFDRPFASLVIRAWFSASARRRRIERALEHANDMLGKPRASSRVPSAIWCRQLVPSATISVSRRSRAHRRQQRELGHRASTRRNAPRRSRSCRPCRSSSISTTSTVELRHQREHAARRRRPRRRPSDGNGRAAARAFRAARCSGSVRRPAACSRARNSSNRNARSRERFASSPRPSTRNSSRNDSRHDGSRPTIAAPRSTCGASAATMRRASTRASSTMPAARYVRPQHSGRVRSRSSPPAARPRRGSRRRAAPRAPHARSPARNSW